VRRVVFLISVSLDGYFEGPAGEIDWHRVDEDLHRHLNDELRTAGAFLDGRVTWELMASVWPAAADDPAASAVTADFGRIWVQTPKVVFSRTLEQAGWNSTVRREVDPAEIRALKEQQGGDLFVGGPDLARSFFAAGLVDELRIYVHPVLAGGGRRPFPDGPAPAGLELVEHRAFGNGVVLLRYRIPAGSSLGT
jgi:dihydrofolate reductase